MQPQMITIVTEVPTESETSMLIDDHRRSELSVRLSFWQRIVRNFRRGWRRSRVTTMIYLISLVISVIQFSSTLIALLLSSKQTCDAPLKQFLFTICWTSFCMIPLTIVDAAWAIPYGPQFYTTSRGQWINRINTILECATFTAYIFGNVWILSATTCSSTSPIVYYTSLVWLLYGYLVISLPMILCVMIVCCLPLAMRIFGQNSFMYDYYQGTTRQGLSSTQIQKIPTKLYDVSNHDNSPSTDETVRPHSTTCAICLGDFESEDILRSLDCSHDFHKECLDAWLQISGTCPLCMQRVVIDQIE